LDGGSNSSNIRPIVDLSVATCDTPIALGV